MVIITDLQQQGGRKKRTAKRLCSAKFTGLFLLCLFCCCLQSPLNIAMFWTFAKKSVKRKVKFSGISFQMFNNYFCHAFTRDEVLPSSFFCHSDA